LQVFPATFTWTPAMNDSVRSDRTAAANRRKAPLRTPSPLNGTTAIASASLIEGWIGETARRSWFLFETGRAPDAAGH
jgi:hypothetical protein